MLQSYLQYATQGTGNLVIHPVSDSTVYANPITLAANATPSTTVTGAQTTHFDYAWASTNSVQIKSITETLPAVTDEGTTTGAGSKDQIITNFGSFGEVKDRTAGGFTTTYSNYDDATERGARRIKQVGNGQKPIKITSESDAFRTAFEHSGWQLQRGIDQIQYGCHHLHRRSYIK